jgi:hypothetical protein
MAAKRGPREEESVLRVDGREYVCYVFVTKGGLASFPSLLVFK